MGKMRARSSFIYSQKIVHEIFFLHENDSCTLVTDILMNCQVLASFFVDIFLPNSFGNVSIHRNGNDQLPRIIFAGKYLTASQTGISTMIGRATVQETGIPRHHGGTIKGHPTSLRNATAVWYRNVQGEPSIGA